MRKYQEIWEKLKKESHVTLDFPRSSHNTLLKGLRKESAKDSAYRFRCVDKGCSYRIRFTQVGDTLRLYLEFSNTVPPSFVLSPERLARNAATRNKYVGKHDL